MSQNLPCRIPNPLDLVSIKINFEAKSQTLNLKLEAGNYSKTLIQEVPGQISSPNIINMVVLTPSTDPLFDYLSISKPINQRNLSLTAAQQDISLHYKKPASRQKSIKPASSQSNRTISVF